VSTSFAALLAFTNILALWVGFALGDDAHHEVADIADEATFDRHVQQALYAARRTP